MRKVFVFALAIVMVMAMAVPAFAAVPSSAAKAEEMLPEVDTAKTGGTLATVEDVEKLPEEAKETFAEAQNTLAEAAPKDMVTKFFFYFTPAAETKNDVAPGTLIISVPDVEKVVIKQFVNGKWVELEYELDEDGNIVLKDLAEGPVAVFTK